MAARLGDVGNPSSLHASGRARPAAGRGGPRDRSPRRSAPGPARSLFTGGGTESDNLAVKGLYWAAPQRGPAPAPHPGQRGRAPRGDGRRALAGRARGRRGRVAAGRRRRPGPPRDARGGPRGRPRLGRAGHGHVGQQRGRHRPADRRAGRGRVARTACRSTPTRCRRSAQLPARLRGQRPGRDDGHRAQDRRPARRRRCWCSAATVDLVPVLHGGGQERDVRSGTLDTPAIVGSRRGGRGGRQAPGRARRAARRPARRPGAPGARRSCPTPSSAVTRDLRRSTACPATRTSPSPAARATPCCCCSTPAASSARPGRPARPACPQPSHVLLAMGVPEDAGPRLAAVLPRAHLHRRPTSTPSPRRSARWSSGRDGPARTASASEAPDEGARRDVGRGGLRGRRRPRGRGRPRRDRRAPGAVQQPAVVPHRGARLLHPRGRPRRPARGRRDRDPVLRLGPGRAVPRRTWSTTSSRSTPRAAPRTRACAATRRSSSRRCWTRRWRSASTRSAPATTPGSTDGRLLPGRRRGQGPVLRAGRAHRASRWRTRCSRSATPARARSGARPSSAAWRWPTSRTATTSASSPTATPPASCSARSAATPGPVVDTDGVQVGEHDGAYAFTVGQRKGLRIGRPAADGLPRYVLDIVPGDQHRHRRHRRAARRRAAGRGPAGLDRPGPRAYRRHVSRRCARTATRSPPPPGARGTPWCVELAEPLRGVAPGQAVVLYDGDAVLGSATIDATTAVPATI